MAGLSYDSTGHGAALGDVGQEDGAGVEVIGGDA